MKAVKTLDYVVDSGGRLDYELQRMPRKTIAIHVDDDGRVIVKAPDSVPDTQIRQTVLQKAEWIRSRLENAASIERRRIRHRFAQGEPFLYLGSYYRLHVQYDCNIRQACVSLKDDQLLLQTPLLDKKLMETAILLWYHENALKLMQQRVDYYAPAVGQRPQKVLIREQKSRWGSCNSKRELRLNWKLIMAPPAVLDYVVIHEMCHLVEMNHSSRFWNLVERILPDYRKCRQWLKENGALLSFEVA